MGCRDCHVFNWRPVRGGATGDIRLVLWMNPMPKTKPTAPTQKQIVVLKAILAFQAKNDGNSPSYRDLMKATKTSLGNIQAHLRRMTRDGFVKHKKGHTRAIKVLWTA